MSVEFIFVCINKKTLFSKINFFNRQDFHQQILFRDAVGAQHQEEEGTLPWATPCLGPSRFFCK